METQLYNQFTCLLFRTDCFKINEIIVFTAAEDVSSVIKILCYYLLKSLAAKGIGYLYKIRSHHLENLCIREPAVSSKKIWRKTFSSIIHTDIFIVKCSLNLGP